MRCHLVSSTRAIQRVRQQNEIDVIHFLPHVALRARITLVQQTIAKTIRACKA